MSLSPATCDPARLAALARAGDLSALDELTRCQGERLLAVGRQHCRDEEDARDAVQEALLAAVQHLDSYRGDGPLDGWVIRMVARFCGRTRRGRKNDPSLHDREVELSSPAAGPEEAAHLARMAGALGDALLLLNPMDRAVLLLAEAEGWTGPHIAAEIGATPEAVRARLTRARRRVRGVLEERLGRGAGT